MMLPSTREACVCVVFIALIIVLARSSVFENILPLRYWLRLSATARRAREFVSRCFPWSQLVKQSPCRPCTVAVCTSAQEFNIRALINKLEKMRPNGKVTFQYVELPYNDLDSFRLDRKLYDGVILCHSIHNRRFSITDVLDALYDRFLPYVKSLFGKNNVCVIVHDFPWPLVSSTTKITVTTDHNRKSSGADDHARVKEGHMESFKVRQPTTHQCCDLAMICGKLDIDVEMDNDDEQKIETFLDNVHQPCITPIRYEITNTHRIVRYVLPLVLGRYSIDRSLRWIKARNRQIIESADKSDGIQGLGYSQDTSPHHQIVRALDMPQTVKEKEKSEDVVQQKTKNIVSPGQKQQDPSIDRSADTCKERERLKQSLFQQHIMKATDIPPTLQGQQAVGTGHHNPQITSGSAREQLEERHKLIGRSIDYNHSMNFHSTEDTFIQHHRERALDRPSTLPELPSLTHFA